MARNRKKISVFLKSQKKNHESLGELGKCCRLFQLVYPLHSLFSQTSCRVSVLHWLWAREISMSGWRHNQLQNHVKGFFLISRICSTFVIFYIYRITCDQIQTQSPLINESQRVKPWQCFGPGCWWDVGRRRFWRTGFASQHQKNSYDHM